MNLNLIKTISTATIAIAAMSITGIKAEAQTPQVTIFEPFSATQLIDATANQLNRRLLSPTHYIRVQVGSAPLGALRINSNNVILSEEAKDYEIKTQNDQEIIPTVAVSNDRKEAILTFPQPVAPGTTLEVQLDDVHYGYEPLYPTIVQYSVFSSNVGYTEERN